jgi:hypothetical protein
MVTRLQAGRPGFDAGKVQGGVSFRYRVHVRSGFHPASYAVGVWGSFRWKKSRWHVHLTTHLHQLLRLRMHGLYLQYPTHLHGVVFH